MKFQTVKGMRDFPPEVMEKRLFVLDTIRRMFERWGYQPLDTPVLEDFKLLAAKGGGGQEIKREIYYFKDQAKRELGMRFDLTVPMARFVANNPNLPKPFKRYQMGKVWRYDQPQKGRMREFQQTDVDVMGSSSPKADAEIASVICDVFKELGFKNFLIRISNKKILGEFAKSLGLKSPVEVFRAVDKLDKIGKDGVKRELLKVTSKQNTEKILKFISGKALPDCEGSRELKAVVDEIKKLGFGKNIKIDLSLVRGLEYYTGTVFEVFAGKKWSLAGGGRYDNMIEKFGGKPTPAVGISIGFERVMVVMEEEKMFKLNKKKVFVAGVNDKVEKQVISIADLLRKSGISTEIDLMGRNFRKKLDYVSKRGIEFCIIIGPKELKEKKVVLRNMKSGKEKKVLIKSLGKWFS